MLWLLGEIWVWCLISFLLGALVTGLVFVIPAKRRMATTLSRSPQRPRQPARSQPFRAAQPRGPGYGGQRARDPGPPGSPRSSESRTTIRYPQRDFDD
ncbi:MAG: hypothetical protein GEU98_02315 [Pseudonocardiaceae bacterium]|nr:hypothetical protein [Pseudonocardiaceae bacterium]